MFNSETAREAGKKSKRGKAKQKKIYEYQHIADAAGVSIHILKHAIKNGEIDVNNLRSISYYIVKKTLSIPLEIKQEKI